MDRSTPSVLNSATERFPVVPPAISSATERFPVVPPAIGSAMERFPVVPPAIGSATERFPVDPLGKPVGQGEMESFLELSREAQSPVSDSPSKSSVPDFEVRVRDEVTGTIDVYTADQLDSKIFDTLFNLWKTSDENGPVRITDIIETLDRNVRIIGLRDPSTGLLTSIGVPGASVWGSIIQEAPIDIVDKPLGSIERCVEVGGIIAGVITGHLTMAWACFKALLHNEVRRMSVKVIDHLINSSYSKDPAGNESVVGENRIVCNAYPATHSFEENATVVEAERQRAERERTARAEQAERQRVLREWAEQVLGEWAERQRAERERTARAEQAERQRVLREWAEQVLGEWAERQRAARERTARAEQQAIADAFSKGHSSVGDAAAKSMTSVFGRGYKVSEGREAAEFTSMLSGNARSVGSASRNRRKPVVDPQNRSGRSFKFIRLRIYYDYVHPSSSVSVGRPSNLTRLIVARESGEVLLPDLSEITNGVGANSVGGMGGDFTVLNETCQLWNVADEKDFSRDPISAGILRQNLRRIFLGYPLDLTGGGLVVQYIPSSSVGQYMDTNTGCIEVIGIIDGSMPTDTKVACLGFKAPARDDLFRTVISALDKLVATNQP